MQVLTLVSDDDLAEADADLAKAIEHEQSSRLMSESLEDELAKLDFLADEIEEKAPDAIGSSVGFVPALPAEAARGSAFFLAGAVVLLTVQYLGGLLQP